MKKTLEQQARELLTIRTDLLLRVAASKCPITYDYLDDGRDYQVEIMITQKNEKTLHVSYDDSQGGFGEFEVEKNDMSSINSPIDEEYLHNVAIELSKLSFLPAVLSSSSLGVVIKERDTTYIVELVSKANQNEHPQGEIHYSLDNGVNINVHIRHAGFLRRLLSRN